MRYHENWQPAWRNPEIKKEYEDYLEYQKIQKEYFKKYPKAIKPALISQLAGINIHDAHMMIRMHTIKINLLQLKMELMIQMMVYI